MASAATRSISSGVAFAMIPGTSNYRATLGVSKVSIVTSASLTARFAADGVRCDAKARRTDLIALIQGAEESVTTITPPATTSLVVVNPVPVPPSVPKQTN